MVQKESTGAGEPVRLREVGGEPGPADVFEHTDAHDLVEVDLAWEVAVVPDLNAATVRGPASAMCARAKVA